MVYVQKWRCNPPFGVPSLPAGEQTERTEKEAFLKAGSLSCENTDNMSCQHEKCANPGPIEFRKINLETEIFLGKHSCWQALTSFPSLWTMLMYSSLEQCLALWLELPDTWPETLLSWMFLMPLGTIGLDTDTATPTHTNTHTKKLIHWFLFGKISTD